MRRAIRSNENRANRRSRKQNTDTAHDPVPYDQVKTGLSESQVEEEEWTNDNVRLRALRLAGSSASASDSDNLVSTES